MVHTPVPCNSIWEKHHLNQQIFKCPCGDDIIQLCAPKFKLPGTKRKSDCLPDVIIFRGCKVGHVQEKITDYLVWIRFAVYQIVVYQGGHDWWYQWYPCLDVHKMPWKKVANIFSQMVMMVIYIDIPWLKAKNHWEQNKKQVTGGNTTEMYWNHWANPWNLPSICTVWSLPKCVI